MEENESVGAPARGEDRMRIDEAFVAEMKRRRSLLNLTQGELATRLTSLGENLYQQTIAKLEAGQRALKLSEADAIARALGTTVQEMLAGVYGVPPWATYRHSRSAKVLEEAVTQSLAELQQANAEEEEAKQAFADARDLLEQAEARKRSASFAYVVAAEKRTRLQDQYQHYVAELASLREVEEKTGKPHRPRKRGSGFTPADENENDLEGDAQ